MLSKSSMGDLGFNPASVSASDMQVNKCSKYLGYVSDRRLELEKAS